MLAQGLFWRVFQSITTRVVPVCPVYCAVVLRHARSHEWGVWVKGRVLERVPTRWLRSLTLFGRTFLLSVNSTIILLLGNESSCSWLHWHLQSSFVFLKSFLALLAATSDATEQDGQAVCNQGKHYDKSCKKGQLWATSLEQYCSCRVLVLNVKSRNWRAAEYPPGL